MNIRHSRLLVLVIGFATTLIFSIHTAPGVFAQTATTTEEPETFKGLIEEKALQLQKIQEQRDAVQKNLDEVSESKNTLNKEIVFIDGTINHLNLSIKANTLTIEQLGFEIESLDSNIEEFKKRIAAKRETVLRLFVALQQHEHENALVVLLRNMSLSRSVAELQSIEMLSSSLLASVGELRDLQTKSSGALEEAKHKKSSREVEQTTLVSRQSIIQEQKAQKQILFTQTKSQEKIYEQQIDELEKVQLEISAEIEKYEAELRKSIDPNLLPLPRHGVFAQPLPNPRITQGYGTTKFALRNYRGKFHNGVDFGAPIGTEVFSVEDGVVINVGDQDTYRGCRKAGYGRFIVVKHDNGLTTLYGHLSKYIVQIGQKVTRGQVIGYVGRTGWATGPHLHFTVFASQTLTPARPSFPEGTKASRVCGPMPVGGDIDPTLYL